MLKLAISADGKVGAGRRPVAITGEAVHDRVHLLRAQNDADEVIGIGTVLADDPMLTCRLPGMAKDLPVRIIADSMLRLPLNSRLAKSAYATPVWAIAGMSAPQDAEFRCCRSASKCYACPRAPTRSILRMRWVFWRRRAFPD